MWSSPGSISSVVEDYDLASHLRRVILTLFSVLMYSFSGVTLGELENRDIYFNSQI